MHYVDDEIEIAFAAIGARVRSGESERPFSIDIRNDGYNEFFELSVGQKVRVSVVDVRNVDRHLLLTVNTPGAIGRDLTSTYLCGRDERHWFVAAIPERAEARDVQAAKDALKPQAVWDAMRDHDVQPEFRDQRRTAAFIRQGEWFFIPRRGMRVTKTEIHHNEPIQCGRGKPHSCQFLYRPRDSGEMVWVADEYPSGLTNVEYETLPSAERRRLRWRLRVRDSKVYIKGNIRHPDHKTVWLSDWHEVVMNTETESAAMADMAFLD